MRPIMERPKSDREKFPTVVLHQSQTSVELPFSAEKEAIQSAYRMTTMSHEWEWTLDEQCSMATYVL